MGDFLDDSTKVRVRKETENEETDSTGKATLVVLAGDHAGRTYTISGEVLIGRTPEAQVQITNDDVSRRHALIKLPAERWFVIEDLGSLNGTRVNGIAISEQELKFGDRIRIGSKTLLLFSQHDPVEDELLQSQRLEAIGRLAGGVAHDFNNILGAIQANVDYLNRLSPKCTLDSKEIRECFRDTDRAVGRAVDLTRQLLGLARRGAPEARPFDLVPVLEEVASLVMRTFSRRITVKMEVAPELMVSGNPSQLHQVLMNLCINARDAMSAGGGTLSIEARQKRVGQAEVQRLPSLSLGLYVEVIVRDTGVGIPREIRDKVFEPFFTTKKDGQGTGLGLATTLNIIQQHGGQIQLDSAPGRGSRFRILLPALKAPSEVQPVASPAAPETNKITTGLILLVDDDEVFLHSTSRLLEGLGYLVKMALDGVEAVRIFEERRDMIQLVLLDVLMPRMDGLKTFHQLRRINPLVKVLVISGQSGLGDVHAMLAAGAQGFLQKPYSASALEDAISRSLFRPA